MKIKKTSIINIDLDAEIKRVKKVLTKTQWKRLIPIYQNLENGNFDRAVQLAERLPYNKVKEYPEIEHLGIEITEFLQDYVYGSVRNATYEVLND